MDLGYTDTKLVSIALLPTENLNCVEIEVVLSIQISSGASKRKWS